MKELIKEQLEKQVEKLGRNQRGNPAWCAVLDSVAKLAGILRDLEVAEAAARYPWVPVDTNKCGPK